MERKNGRKDRRVGGREEKKGEGPGCRTSLTLVLLDLPFLYLFPFYFQNISWCLTPPSTQFQARGCTSRKLCEPLPMPVCFTGRHPPSLASTMPPVLGSQPQEDCTSWPRDESSGGHQGMSLSHHWPSTRSCSGRPSPLICAKVSHDMLSPPPSWAAHQGIGALRLHGVGAGECL